MKALNPWEPLTFRPCEQCDAAATTQVGSDPIPDEDRTDEDRLMAEIFGPEPPDTRVMLLCDQHARSEMDRRLDAHGAAFSQALRRSWSEYLSRFLPLYTYPVHRIFADGSMARTGRRWALRWQWPERLRDAILRRPAA